MDFAVSSAGAHHPIYSSTLWSLQCQPLAESDGGQPLQLINYAKAINAFSKQRLTLAQPGSSHTLQEKKKKGKRKKPKPGTKKKGK